MNSPSSRARYVLERPWRFTGQVLAGFRANQGLLLAGAVAYYTLLSIIPMFALILVLLSQFKEAAAVILLLGAQVIAEYERIGLPPIAPHGLQT